MVYFLADACVAGLHIDDILYLLGFNTKAGLIASLCDLNIRNIFQKEVDGRWQTGVSKVEPKLPQNTI